MGSRVGYCILIVGKGVVFFFSIIVFGNVEILFFFILVDFVYIVLGVIRGRIFGNVKLFVVFLIVFSFLIGVFVCCWRFGFYL